MRAVSAYWGHLTAKSSETSTNGLDCSESSRGGAAFGPNGSPVRRNSKIRLVDHLVGEDVELRRDRHAERVGGLAIDHQVEFRRLLDRQVAGLGAFEDLIHIRRGAAEKIGKVLAVAHQPARHHVFPLPEHRRQPICQREFGNSPTLSEENSVARYYERLHPRLGECSECTLGLL